MGEGGGELAGGGEALGLLHLIDLVAEFAVDLFELVGGGDEAVALLTFAIGDGTGDDAGDAEDGEFDDLILGVQRPGDPMAKDGGGLHDGGKEDCGEGAAPAEEQAGEQEGKDVHVVQDVVRFDICGRDEPGDDGEREDEDRDESGADARSLGYREGAGHAVILPCERRSAGQRAARSGRRGIRQDELGGVAHAGWVCKWGAMAGRVSRGLSECLCELLHDMGQRLWHGVRKADSAGDARRGERAEMAEEAVIGVMVSDVQSRRV